MKIQKAKAHVEKLQHFRISYEEREEDVKAMEKELENLVKVCLGAAFKK